MKSKIMCSMKIMDSNFCVFCFVVGRNWGSLPYEGFWSVLQQEDQLLVCYGTMMSSRERIFLPSTYFCVYARRQCFFLSLWTTVSRDRFACSLLSKKVMRSIIDGTIMKGQIIHRGTASRGTTWFLILQRGRRRGCHRLAPAHGFGGASKENENHSE